MSMHILTSAAPGARTLTFSFSAGDALTDSVTQPEQFPDIDPRTVTGDELTRLFARRKRTVPDRIVNQLRAALVGRDLTFDKLEVLPPLQRRQERQILARKGRYPVDFSIFQFTLARGVRYLV